jgi:Kef-type K+ transport system membrane component KefB/Trk K+ transport system NAD-binding subunit
MNDGKTFTEIASILGVATVLGIFGQKFRQPLIIMFLVAGILAGPSCFGMIHSHEEIELLAEIGIALLLFIVGLKLDLNLIRTTGPVALAAGLGQIVFTSLIGFLIAIGMGISYLSAAYVSVALTFSSTIIIVKLLSDKKEVDSLHGQIALGFLIVQDIAAILALVALTTLGTSVSESESRLFSISMVAAKGLGMLGAVALLMRYFIPTLTRYLAHSLELLTLFAVAWAVIFGAASEILGFSKEVGAFLAGVSLASTDYRDSIGGRLTSLRDFLLLFFFIDLGSRLDWSTVGTQLGASLIFSLFVLIGNPLIVLIIIGAMGYRRRTAFLAGLTVAQISEFSLILAALGMNLGHIPPEIMGLITLVGVVTIFLSTYMILYSYPLYDMLSGWLKIFERQNPFRESAIDTLEEPQAAEVILVGLGNYGSGIAEYLIQRNRSVLGVDFDPNVLGKWREKGIPVVYGDMADPEMHDHLPLTRTKWIISAVRSKEMNLALIHHLHQTGFSGKVALTATNEQEAREFEQAGAHLVFQPFRDATEQAVDAITYAMAFLPKQVDWPLSFMEVRIRTDASTAGKTLQELALSAAGITVLTVSRGGRVVDDLSPDFRIFPADRLLLMGNPSVLKDVEYLLNQPRDPEIIDPREQFETAEIKLAQNSDMSGKTLKDIRFRQKYGVTLVGIRRGREQIIQIDPMERLQGGDCLIVIGKSGAVQQLGRLAPL